MNKRVATAVIAILAIVASLSVALSAQADQYATWQDVLNARASVAARQAEIANINASIATLNTQLDEAKALVQQRGQEAGDARTQADAAGSKAQELQAKADKAKKTAAESKRQAGIIAASLSRVGGQDLSLTLFASGNASAGLLYKLGTMQKLTEVTDSLYAKATSDMNIAQSFTDQAKLAKTEFDRRSGLAQASLQVAVDAQTAYQNKFDSSQATLATFNAQLSVLTQNRDATQADYNAGMIERARIEAARVAAAKAAEAARVATAAAGKAGSLTTTVVSAVSRSGWANPLTVSNQWISSPYGYRADPFNGGYAFHHGTDIAVSCGTATYAAYGGQVTYAGWYGDTLGNVVIIDHGGSTQTLYAHLESASVSSGVTVATGQLIARSGSSGAATGCHLHLGVFVGSFTTDPQPFMQDRSITLGRP